MNRGFAEIYTQFYWAWWLSFGLFLGMFIARLSRGRTVRNTLLGSIGFGSLGCAAFMLIMDGGLGLLKVALIRVFKIHILKNTLTPLHDHVRKKLDWSNTQTVFRFAIIQIVLSAASVYMLLLGK